MERELDEGSDTFPQWRLIGLFAPAVDPSAPFISVSVTNLPFEVSLEDWVDFFCGMDGWEVFSSRWWSTPAGLVIDTGAVKGSGNTRDVMRVMAIADKGRIFMTSGVAQADAWNKWKDDFLIACSTFELVNPTHDESLEPKRDWEGGHPSCGIRYPISWRLREQDDTPEGKTGVEVQLTTGEELLAYALVKATDLEVHPATTLSTLLDQALLELESSDLIPVGERVFIPTGRDADFRLPPGWITGPSSQDALASQVEGYQGTAVVPVRTSGENGRELEARLGFKIVKGMAFTIYLVSIRQEKNFLLWMRGKRAFEVMRSGMWKKGSKPKAGAPRAAAPPKGSGTAGVLRDAGWSMLSFGRFGATGTSADTSLPLMISNASADPHIPPLWMPDTDAHSCFGTGVEFSMLRRKHHCRNCGLVFSGPASAGSIALPMFGFNSAVRVCTGCHACRGVEAHVGKTSALSKDAAGYQPQKHLWLAFGLGSMIKYKVVHESSPATEVFVTKSLRADHSPASAAPSNGSYRLTTTRRGVDGQKTTRELTIPTWDGYLPLLTDGAPHGQEVVSVDGRKLHCSVRRSSAKIQGSEVEQLVWVSKELAFPVKVVIRSGTRVYLDQVVVVMADPVSIGDASAIPCIRVDGKSTKTLASYNYSYWYSQTVPGGIVKAATVDSSGASVMTAVQYSVVKR